MLLMMVVMATKMMMMEMKMVMMKLKMVMMMMVLVEGNGKLGRSSSPAPAKNARLLSAPRLIKNCSIETDETDATSTSASPCPSPVHQGPLLPRLRVASLWTELGAHRIDKWIC